MGIEKLINIFDSINDDEGAIDRRGAIKRITGLGLLLLPAFENYASPNQIKIINHLSPWSQKRAKRPNTKYIILHTTEANGTSSLNSVTKDGTANFVVDTDGKIYLTVHQDKISKHAGRSMWNNLKNLSNHSVGIEIVGYHNKSITDKQYSAVKGLISKLQKDYNLSDNHVLAHSMVAYGNPNRWYDEPFRGRRLCGMHFGLNNIRKKLGLTEKPSYDPDVKSGRLKLSKEGVYLSGLFWGKKEMVPPPIRPEPESEDIDKISYIGVDGKNAFQIARGLYNKNTCIYLLNDGRVRTGKELSKTELDRLPKGTGMLVGYINGGKVKNDRTAYSVIGKRWNYESTFYVIRNKANNTWVIKSGDEIDDQKISEDTWVFFRD